MKLTVGSIAPDFSLPDSEGVMHALKDYHGKYVLIYFYPKDDTPGCTTEACSFRDNVSRFKERGITVLGVSADSAQKHQKFAAKYKLPFTLLSDESKDMLLAYGVWGKKKFIGREYDGIFRNSFLIDPEGKILKIYENVKPAKHIEEILQDFAELTA